MRITEMRFLSGLFPGSGRKAPPQQDAPEQDTLEERLYTTLACRSMPGFCGLDFRNPTPALRADFARLAEETAATLTAAHGPGPALYAGHMR